MNETASHCGYKSLRSFCFEAFKYRLYPNAVTHTTSEWFTEQNCLVYYVFNTGARLIRS